MPRSLSCQSKPSKNNATLRIDASARPTRSSYWARALDVWYSQPDDALLRAVEACLLGGLEMARPILDLGCGNGQFATVLGKVIDVGLDMDSSALAVARSSGLYKHLARADICKMPLESARFQTVFSNSVFEHIPDLGSALAEAWRVLAPGGLFAITVPTDQYGANTLQASLYRRLGLLSRALAYEGALDRRMLHKHRMSINEWGFWLSRTGFTVRCVRPCWFPITMRTWGLLRGIVRFGIGRYRMNAVIHRLPRPFRRLVVCLWTLLLSRVYDWDLREAFVANEPSPGGNVLLVATKPCSRVEGVVNT